MKDDGAAAEASDEGEDDEGSGSEDEGDFGAEDDEKVQLSELLSGLGVNDDGLDELTDEQLARAGYRTDDEDRRFLAGEFVPEDDAVAAKVSAAASPDAKAAAAAFLADPSPPKFNFL